VPTSAMHSIRELAGSADADEGLLYVSVTRCFDHPGSLAVD